MIEELGTVVDLQGDLARVRTERHRACGGCAADGACGTSLADRLLGRRPVVLLARNPLGALPGERVVVGVTERGLLVAALAVYLVPLLGLLCGALLGDWAGARLAPAAGDRWPLFGGFGGFLLALSWLRGYSAHLSRDPARYPLVLRRCGPGSSVLAVDLPQS
jgi:sigma-E factor negative regulatory protein RseC